MVVYSARLATRTLLSPNGLSLADPALTTAPVVQPFSHWWVYATPASMSQRVLGNGRWESGRIASVENSVFRIPSPTAAVSGPSRYIGAKIDRSWRSRPRSVAWPATGWAGIHMRP